MVFYFKDRSTCHIKCGCYLIFSLVQLVVSGPARVSDPVRGAARLQLSMPAAHRTASLDVHTPPAGALYIAA